MTSSAEAAFAPHPSRAGTDPSGRAATAIDIDGVVVRLRASRRRWRAAQRRPNEPGGRELPAREALQAIVAGLRGALFPMRLGPADLLQENEDDYIGHTLGSVLHALVAQVRLELTSFARLAGTPPTDNDTAEQHAVESVRIVREFAALLPAVRDLLDTDVEAAFRGDPAAHSVDEVLLCYPGIEAMIHHRLAHNLYRLGAPMIARTIAEQAHAQTGIDIHPGARIGPGFFIDHGTGVVIGETAVIGARVRVYQAVTLGAKRFPVDENGEVRKGAPRHPIVEDDVVVYAGATILGRITIGAGSTIGGNVWVTRDVPPGSSVTQASLRSEPRPAIPE